MRAMRTSYLVSRHEGTWGLYLWQDDIQIIQAGLPDEATAFEEATRHAKANGNHTDYRILQTEENGNIKTVFDTEHFSRS